jgi:hypothetical protein
VERVMEEYFGSTNDELPSVRQITGDDFSEPNFQPDEFLTRFCQFQTLEDLQIQLKKWDETFGQELIEVINEDYGDFVGLGNSLTGGDSKVQDIKMDVLLFQGEVKKVRSELEKSVHDTDSLLKEKGRLTALEDRARQIILYVKRLNDIERRLSGLNSAQEVEEVGKSYFILKLLERQIVDQKGHPVIEDSYGRVARIKSTLLTMIDDTIKTTKTRKDRAGVLDLVILKQKLSSC